MTELFSLYALFEQKCINMINASGFLLSFEWRVSKVFYMKIGFRDFQGNNNYVHIWNINYILQMIILNVYCSPSKICYTLNFQNFCKFLGGKLAEPMTKDENDFLMNQTSQIGNCVKLSI